MKTSIPSQKNNLEKLTKVLGIGTLTYLGYKANGQWLAEYTTSDNIVRKENTWYPIHACFTNSSLFHLLSS